MVKLRNGLRLTRDVVTDERPPEAVATHVGVAAMDDGAVEEEDISGGHEDRLRCEVTGNRNRYVREAYAGVRLLGAEDGQISASGNDAHAPVLLVAGVECQPGGHTSPRLDPQVELVLVK